MSTAADQTIVALRANHATLADRVAAFKDADLDRPSGASEWDVAQVLSHLGSGAEINLAGLRAAAAGEPAPGQEFNESIWDRWNAMGQQEKAESFLRANEQLVDFYESLDDDARRSLTIKLGFMPAPIDLATAAGMRLNEAALHAWDVNVAFDPGARLTSTEADIAIDLYAGPLSFLLGFIGKPDALDGVETALRVQTTDSDRELTLVLGPQISVSTESSDASGVLIAPAEAFVRLLTGRLGPVYTPESVSLDSDAVSLGQLRLVFKGF